MQLNVWNDLAKAKRRWTEKGKKGQYWSLASSIEKAFFESALACVILLQQLWVQKPVLDKLKRLELCSSGLPKEDPQEDGVGSLSYAIAHQGHLEP